MGGGRPKHIAGPPLSKVGGTGSPGPPHSYAYDRVGSIQFVVCQVFGNPDIFDYLISPTGKNSKEQDQVNAVVAHCRASGNETRFQMAFCLCQAM